MLRLGARGFIPKTSSPEVLVAALRLVIAGGTYVPHAGPEIPVGLEQRQQLVLDLAASGASNVEIAKSLRVSESTVRAELTQIFKVLAVSNRTQAVVEALRRGWIRAAKDC